MQDNANAESVRIIRDRETGKSRGFAFVRFPSIEESTAWLSMRTHGLTLGGMRVRMEYATLPKVSEEDWTCAKCLSKNFTWRTACFVCHVPKTVLDVAAVANDGSRDIGDVPNPILLLRGLDPLTTDEALFRQMNAVVPLLGVRLVRARASRVSYGFAFAEFKDLDAANYLLGLIYNQQSPQPLVIDGRVVAVAYSHLKSFLPVYTSSPWVSATYVEPSGGHLLVAYWDEQAYTVQYPPNQPLQCAPLWLLGGHVWNAAGSATGSASGSSAAASKATAAGAAAATGAAAVIRAPQQPQARLDDQLAAFYSNVADSETGGDPSLVSSKEASADASGAGDASVAGAGAGTGTGTGTGKKGVAKKAATGTTKRIAVQLQKWQSKHEELKDFDVTELDRPAVVDISDEALMARLPSEGAVNEEYSDLSIMACLLCERQFKSGDDLRKHQAKSALHKTNMAALRQKQLEQMRQQAMAAAAAAAASGHGHKKRRLPAGGSSSNSNPNANANPNLVAVGSGRGRGSGSGMGAAGGPLLITPSVESDALGQGIPATNKGSRMLQKMGWKAGTGLGADGRGIVAPVDAQVYASGAGIGAGAVTTASQLSGTVVLAAGRGLRDPNAYQEQARRVARQRLSAVDAHREQQGEQQGDRQGNSSTPTSTPTTKTKATSTPTSTTSTPTSTR
ncbi:hypothetical protein BC831DRAFT_206964 [Entophlyctis helioformis]|nr:hypothetical protein BC831DRAFT_206964 [Entophlyctis helioformis]